MVHYNAVQQYSSTAVVQYSKFVQYRVTPKQNDGSYLSYRARFEVQLLLYRCCVQVQYRTVQYRVIHFNTVQQYSITVQYRTLLQHSAVQCSNTVIPYSIVHYNAVQQYGSTVHSS